MAFLSKSEVYDAYTDAVKEADIWREDYSQYERLMDNGLMDGLVENLPEVNDGSLAASLFKLAKRVIRKKLGGRANAEDSDEPWVTELANIEWEKNILKNANSMSTPRRKWKDAVRKAAGYGSQPIITLFVERGRYTGADFIVPYAQDVKLEAGKCSDMDSDIIFWDVYYTKLQVKNMIEQAKNENKEAKAERESWELRKAEKIAMGEEFDEDEPAPYNKWNIAELEKIVETNAEEDRPGNEEAREKQEKGAKKSGIHFYIAFQRGVNAPFYMCHNKKTVREWSNPDPSGDIPVHYLYCYQDFVNPYGIGIVKLAGGTQNVIDYLTQADILATQIGISPPKMIKGDESSVDLTSMTMTPDANWFIGQTQVEPWNMANGIYNELPGRMSMYQTRLQKMMPMGDTSASAQDSGDPTQSKTPAGVKLQAANLSIDDEDFSENVDECYAAVAQSMINTHFANMQGSDLRKLTDDERQMLIQAGLEWNLDEVGQPIGNELDVLWDNARATFTFEIDPEADKTQDEEKRLEGLLKVAEFANADPNFDLYMAEDGKKLNRGELYSEIVGLTSDNDKIIQDITPEEQNQMQMDAAMQPQIDPETGMPMEQPMEEPMMEEEMPQEALEGEVMQPEMQPSPEEEAMANVEAVMQEFGVDEMTALAMLEAESQGFSPEEIQEALLRNQPQPEEAML